MNVPYSLGRIAGTPASFVSVCLGPESWRRGGRLRNAAKAAFYPLAADLLAAIGLQAPIDTRFFQGVVLGHKLPQATNPFAIPLPPCLAVNPGTACAKGPSFLPTDTAIEQAVLSVIVWIVLFYKFGPGVLRGARRHITALALFVVFICFAYCVVGAIHPASISDFWVNAAAAAVLAVCLRIAYRAWCRVDDLR